MPKIFFREPDLLNEKQALLNKLIDSRFELIGKIADKGEISQDYLNELFIESEFCNIYKQLFDISDADLRANINTVYSHFLFGAVVMTPEGPEITDETLDRFESTILSKKIPVKAPSGDNCVIYDWLRFKADSRNLAAKLYANLEWPKNLSTEFGTPFEYKGIHQKGRRIFEEKLHNMASSTLKSINKLQRILENHPDDPNLAAAIMSAMEKRMMVIRDYARCSKIMRGNVIVASAKTLNLLQMTQKSFDNLLSNDKYADIGKFIEQRMENNIANQPLNYQDTRTDEEIEIENTGVSINYERTSPEAEAYRTKVGILPELYTDADRKALQSPAMSKAINAASTIQAYNDSSVNKIINNKFVNKTLDNDPELKSFINDYVGGLWNNSPQKY